MIALTIALGVQMGFQWAFKIVRWWAPPDRIWRSLVFVQWFIVRVRFKTLSKLMWKCCFWVFWLLLFVICFSVLLRVYLKHKLLH